MFQLNFLLNITKYHRYKMSGTNCKKTAAGFSRYLWKRWNVNSAAYEWHIAWISGAGKSLWLSQGVFWPNCMWNHGGYRIKLFNFYISGSYIFMNKCQKPHCAQLYDIQYPILQHLSNQNLKMLFLLLHDWWLVIKAKN